MIVNRTEQIYIREDEQLSSLCHLAKNLYNQANYIINRNYDETHMILKYIELEKILKEMEAPYDDYQKLPAQTSQQIIKLVVKNWRSFFRSLNEYKKNPNKFRNKPEAPHYKKKDGESIVIFTNQQSEIVDNKLIVLPRMIGLEVNTRLGDDIDLREVRIVPLGVGYNLEIVYQKEIPDYKQKKPKRIAGIDLGVNNLVACVNNIGKPPIIIRGGVVKSINQYYNKMIGELQKIYSRQKIYSGKKKTIITLKRNFKIRDYFHKVSRILVKYLLKLKIDTVIIGHNNGWKQEVNLGKETNQKFVQIPFNKLIQMLKYKLEEYGICVIEQEESYTSKCSFLDGEEIEKHDKYCGTRIKRGLFKTQSGKKFNADVNSGYNIMIKAIPNAFRSNGIEGVVLHPIKLSC